MRKKRWVMALPTRGFFICFSCIYKVGATFHYSPKIYTQLLFLVIHEIVENLTVCVPFDEIFEQQWKNGSNKFPPISPFNSFCSLTVDWHQIKKICFKRSSQRTKIWYVCCLPSCMHVWEIVDHSLLTFWTRSPAGIISELIQQVLYHFPYPSSTVILFCSQPNQIKIVCVGSCNAVWW